MVFAFVSNFCFADLASLWNEANKAQKDGLPKTQIKVMDKILEFCEEQKDYSSWMKALSKKITLEATIQGNKPEEKISRLQDMMKKAAPETKALLKTILAQWYWHYYSRNKWRFMNRKRTVGMDDKDIKTWDLPKIFDKIDALYTEVLKEETVLQNVKLSSFKKFLSMGSVPELRPTLYDFIVFEALKFYTCAEQTTANPEDSFELNAESDAFARYDEFLDYTPETTDEDSPKLKAMKLYQKEIKFQTKTGNKKALIDSDLNRLKFVKNFSFGENKDTRYRNRLVEIIEENPDEPISSLARYNLATAWKQEAELVKAYNIAEKGYKIFPKSHGGLSCRYLMNQIKIKNLSINAEKVVPVGKSKIKISYKNFNKLYFRIYKDDGLRFMKKKYSSPDYLDRDEIKKILYKEPFLHWSVDLDETTDYKVKSAELDIPSLKQGYYRVFASWKETFSSSKMVQYSQFWVSDVTLVTRNRSGKTDGFVLYAMSGKPVKSASVKHMVRKDKFYTFKNTYKTDKNGYFSVPYSARGNYYDNYLYVVKGNNRVLNSNSTYFRSKSKTYTNNRCFLFTDRSLYRPGQTVYFKGICVKVNTNDNKYKVIPDKSMHVFFRDANNQEIADIKVVTNDYGSFSGHFTAPSKGLTGRMTINTSSPSSSSVIRVEEYKRPKFKVEMKKPEKAGRLNDYITVSGNAAAYTGAPIDSAKVKYRVVREAKLPRWWYWYYGGSISPAREIIHGTVKTDTKGNFKVKFKAVPDKKYLPSENPTFTFTVYADVIDSTGETRSSSEYVRLGYFALTADLSVPGIAEQGKPIKLDVATKTLNGINTPTKGKIRVFSLKQPKKTHRKEFWSRSDLAVKDSFAEKWEKWPVDEKVFEIGFSTKKINPASIELNLESGFYKIECDCRDSFGKQIKSFVPLMVLPSWDDSKFSLKIPFLTKVRKPTLKPGEELYMIWGTGYNKGQAFIEIEHRKKVIKKFWTNKGETQQRLVFGVKEKFRGGFSVHVTYIRENRAYIKSHNISVPWSNKDLIISTETFHSSLKPGQKEKWTLKIQGKDAAIKAAEMVASLYDSSLDAFYPHSWGKMNIFYRNHPDISSTFLNRSISFSSWKNNWNSYISLPRRSYPSFPGSIIYQLSSYGYPGGGRFGGRKMLMCKSSARGSVLEECEMDLAAPSPNKSNSFAPKNGERKKMKRRAPGKKLAKSNGGVVDNKSKDEVDLSKVSARKNLQESAFFYPHLLMDDDGSVKIEFTIPEALTKWKLLSFAHGKKCENGVFTEYTVTKKDLMVQPNPPRFMREGDELEFTAKVVNVSDKVQKGKVQLKFRDLINEKAMNKKLGIKKSTFSFSIPAGESKGFSWKVKVPVGMKPLIYKVVAASKDHSDGEEGTLPVLTSRVFVTESFPLWVRGPEKRKFEFKKLKENLKSSTLEPFRFTVQMASNPAWYAVQALPYLMEFPHECSEQVFNRLYANSLADFIANSNPKIRKIFDSWRGTDALKSNLEKNQDLKSVLLEETPWVVQAKNETQAKKNVGILFEKNTLTSNLTSAFDKLEKMQLSAGAWPWFPGGRPSEFITLYVVTGFGKLRHLGVKVDMKLAFRAINYLDNWIKKIYDRIKHRERNHLSSTIALYLYGRSFYLKEKPILRKHKEAIDYFLGQGEKFWLSLGRMNQGHLALAMNRFGKKKTPKKVMKSIKERSVSNPEMGMFWRETEHSWWWYRAPIETQAIMIEAFDEVMKDEQAVDDCQVWLLKQKQTQCWKTTKSTADAIYALLQRGNDLLASDKIVQVKLTDMVVKPTSVEPGTGFYEKIYDGSQVESTFADITVIKEDKGIAWGGVFFQYFEDMSKVTSHKTNLSLEKKLFVKKNSKKGPEIHPVKGALEVGDLVTVRITLRVDRDMEFVHMKDHRGSGLEPVNVLSNYKFQDGLMYYEATKDTASHFFIDYLPKGTYVFEYELRVQLKGRYQTGFANIQCMYAPEFSSHSESIWLEVK